MVSESSAWKLDTFRKAIGEAVVEGEEVELHAARLVGRRGYARLKVETYQGKDSNKVESWLTDHAPTSGAKLPAPPSCRPAPPVSPSRIRSNPQRQPPAPPP